ncbi:unnamed protein product [Brassica oleracea var. botrytis]|uniref:Uncharacterized protein n=1 Tax=Brassica oleracea TaxID=3712 RepID=A0A3P6B2P0_BRAOL|nr:unnamed protein product [Brassica oleracea]
MSESSRRLSGSISLLVLSLPISNHIDQSTTILDVPGVVCIHDKSILHVLEYKRQVLKRASSSALQG